MDILRNPDLKNLIETNAHEIIQMGLESQSQLVAEVVFPNGKFQVQVIVTRDEDDFINPDYLIATDYKLSDGELIKL